ncbi:DUF6458 family protein [Terrabacter sp. AAH1]|jgi:hypothetical protein|nr:hypothetical protein UB45_07050 [Terrabacter sp. 28]
MGIGLGIVLLVIGAIFYFTTVDSSVLNMSSGTGNTIGIILMVAGALAVILALVMNAQRARTQHTVVTERRGAPDVVERRVDGDEVVERRTERRDGTI